VVPSPNASSLTACEPNLLFDTADPVHDCGGHNCQRVVGRSLCDAQLVVVSFDAELWLWDARRTDSWTFVSLPAEASEEIRDLAGGPRRGFGSLRVRVTVGGSTWTTSIFPDSARGSYVLPIKRVVRKAEALDVGDFASVTVRLIDL
jgi:hypothetical protein